MNPKRRRDEPDGFAADAEVPTPADSDLHIIIQQLQEQVHVMHQAQEKRMDVMQREVDCLMQQNETLNEELRLLKLDGECSSRCIASLKTSVQILKNCSAWQYSAPFKCYNYWMENHHQDHEYCTRANKFMTEISTKITKLRRDELDLQNDPEFSLGDSLSEQLYHDPAFISHWRELGNAIHLMGNTGGSAEDKLELSISNIQLEPKICHILEDAVKMDKLHYLTLSSNVFIESLECIRSVARTISGSNLYSFVLEDNTIDADSAQLLGQTIADHKNLRQVTIANCCRDEQAGFELLRALSAARGTSYDFIDLEKNHITNRKSYLTKWLESGSLQINEFMSLVENGLNDNDAEEIAIALQRTRKSNHFELSLGKNRISRIGWDVLSRACCDCSSISSLVQSNHTTTICNNETDSPLTKMRLNQVGFDPEPRLSSKLYKLFDSRHVSRGMSELLNYEFGRGDAAAKLVPYVLRFVDFHCHEGFDYLQSNEYNADDFASLSRALPLSVLFECVQTWKIPELLR